MEGLEAFMNEDPTKRELGQNILNHAEELLHDDKVSEQQYLDFCNGARLIHQGFMINETEAATVVSLVNQLCEKVVDAKNREVLFRSQTKLLQDQIRDLQKRNEMAKTTMFNDVVSLESAIQKKAYARARTMIQNQKKRLSSNTRLSTTDVDNDEQLSF